MKEPRTTFPTTSHCDCSGGSSSNGVGKTRVGFLTGLAGAARVVSLISLISLVSGLCPATSRAADVTVANVGDSGPGSLRQAIADVPTGGSIDFGAGLNGQTITLAGELVLNRGLIIDASGLPGG